MTDITPTTQPLTPLEKVKDISSHLGSLLDGLTDTSQAENPSIASNISPHDLTELVQCFRRQQTAIDALSKLPTPPSPLPSPPRQPPAITPDFFSNAKYEDIVCKPFKPQFDGTPDNLVPFLNRLDIRRHNESWGSITYVTVNGRQLDLIRNFSQIPETTVTREAKLRWEAITNSRDKHTLSHPTFNARILAKLLLKSLTDDFSITIVNRIPTALCNDGPLFLWTICHHFHRNNVAFVESTKHRIRSATLANFSNDPCAYILHIKDNLRLITLNDGASSDHNDLLIHLFTQLTSAPIKAFAEWAQKLYVDYLEAKLTIMTPTTFLKDADDKAQVLKHAGQWQDTETPAVMALQAAFDPQRQESHQTIQRLMAHIGQIHRRLPHLQQHRQYTPKHPDDNRDGKRLFSDGSPYSHPTWMVTPP